MAKTKNICSAGQFPTFAVILVVIGIIWLLNDLNILPIDIPWLPVVVIIVGMSMIMHHPLKK